MGIYKYWPILPLVCYSNVCPRPVNHLPTFNRISANSIVNINTTKSLQKSRKQFNSWRKKFPKAGIYLFHLWDQQNKGILHQLLLIKFFYVFRGFFLSDGNDVIQVDSASKPSKNKSKHPDDSKQHSGKDNSKAAVKSDDKTVSESSKDKLNLSEDNPVIKVEIIEDTNKESLDSLTDDLKNMKVETAVKKDSSKTDVSKANASLDEVTDNIDKIKLEPK